MGELINKVVYGHRTTVKSVEKFLNYLYVVCVKIYDQNKKAY